MNTENEEMISHILNCENRGIAKVTGVEDVEYFNDIEVTAVTSCGDLLIKGENLHIESLNLDTGELEVSGNVIALIYSESKKESKGIFKKLFK